MSSYIDARLVPMLNLWNDYLDSDGSVSFNYDDEDETCETLLVEYKKYEGLPTVWTKIDVLVIYKYLYELSKLLDNIIIPQTKHLITCYKNTKEYKASKYYKLDIINQKTQDMEGDFK